MITLRQRSRRLSADLETPISLFLSLTQKTKFPDFCWKARKWTADGGATSIIACDYLMTVSCVDARLVCPFHQRRPSGFPEGAGRHALPGWTALSDAASGAGGGRYRRQAPSHAGSVRLLCCGYRNRQLSPSPGWRRPFRLASAESCLVLAGTVIVFDHLYNRLTQLSLGEHRDLSHAPLHGAEEPSIGEVSPHAGPGGLHEGGGAYQGAAA